MRYVVKKTGRKYTILDQETGQVMLESGPKHRAETICRNWNSPQVVAAPRQLKLVHSEPLDFVHRFFLKEAARRNKLQAKKRMQRTQQLAQGVRK
jgi:hypothetical protein